MSYQAAVITVSDRASAGVYEDKSGPAVAAMLKEAGYEVVYTSIVPDEQEKISEELISCVDEKHCDLVITSGGTGLSPRDVTPEATRAVLEREIPAIPQAMIYYSLQITPRAMLSRAVAGTRRNSLILNLPGSEKAARENLSAVLGALDHALKMIAGGGAAFLADELHQATVLRERLGVVSAEAHARAERSGQINDVARKAVGLVEHEKFAVILPKASHVQMLLRHAEAHLTEEDQRLGLRGGKTARGELERGVVRRGQRRVDPEKAKRGRMDERDLAERRMPHILELAKARVELAFDALELLLLLYDGGLLRAAFLRSSPRRGFAENQRSR